MIGEVEAKALRAPFPAECVGKLPKGGQQLDFVGHANVTDRLLTVDPEWTWEPFALDADGLPKLDKHGNLWIRLTVCGVSRPGYGDGSADVKQLISDALRNAAMRFGVALDLWARGGLESEVDAAQDHEDDKRSLRRLDDDARAGGWEDEPDRRMHDQEAVAKARALSPESKVVYAEWLAEAGIKRPFTRPEFLKVDAKLFELAAVDEKARKSEAGSVDPEDF